MNAARSTVDIGVLDRILQRILRQHGSPSDHALAVWKHDRDNSGCNWTSSLRRVRGTGELIPQVNRSILRLRERFTVTTHAERVATLERGES
jgi:hypothetical protein